MLYFLLSGQLERTKNYVPRKQFWRAVNVLEYKFLSIPIAFFLLRMPTCIINLLYVYIDIGQIPQPLVYLSVSKQHLVYVHYFYQCTHFWDCYRVLCAGSRRLGAGICQCGALCVVDKASPRRIPPAHLL